MRAVQLARRCARARRTARRRHGNAHSRFSLKGTIRGWVYGFRGETRGLKKYSVCKNKFVVSNISYGKRRSGLRKARVAAGGRALPAEPTVA